MIDIKISSLFKPVDVAPQNYKVDQKRQKFFFQQVYFSNAFKI